MLSNDVFRVPVGALCLGQFVNRRESGFGTGPVRLQCSFILEFLGAMSNKDDYVL